MTRVSTRVLKDELSAWLHRAEGGERVIVLRDGRAVAALVPIRDLPADDEEALLEQLAARGEIQLGETAAPLPPPIASGGRSASEMVLEDRR